MIIRTDGYDPALTANKEALFHTANGYIGFRGCPEEGAPEGTYSIRGAYINAFYDTEPIHYAEKLFGFPEVSEHIINIIDVQDMALYAGDERFTMSRGLVSETRTLDMEEGTAARKVVWRTPEGKTFELNIKRMASFVLKNLFLIEYGIKSVDYEGPVTLISSENGKVAGFSDPNDPRVSSNGKRSLATEIVRLIGDTTLMQCKTLHTGFVMATAVRHVCSVSAAIEYKLDADRADTVFRFGVRPGQTAVIQKYCIFTDGRRTEEPAASALELLGDAVRQGASHWFTAQKEYLSEFWSRSRVVIEGDEPTQRLMDFNIYQLLQSAGCDRLSNIPAKGLSGEGYEGHYFWDTEIYMFPFFLLTGRKTARALLSYRYHILDGARRHARSLGHQTGALYPWRTIAGRECSSYYPSGSAQYHINADVAHSVLSYYDVTGDIDYLAEEGAEILWETSRLWLDAGHYDEEGRFRVDCVTGPDEYTCIVNNNYYTNKGAKENLLGSVRVYRLLSQKGLLKKIAFRVTEDEIDKFEHAAEHMYLPYDEKYGIYAQDDTFLQKKLWDIKSIPPEDFPLLLHYHPLYINRHQICKQADTVLALWLFDENVDEKIIERSFDYYEPLTTHDSSLSACVFSIVASRLQRLDRAYEYFKKTVGTDIKDAQGNTSHGLHIANAGGAWLAVTAGFAGLRIRENGLHFRPQCPAGWKSYTFRLFYQKSEVEVSISGSTAGFTLLSGPPVTIFVSERACILERQLVFDVPGGNIRS